ncbi:MAG: flagellar motor switch protein FliN [Thermosulfidibacteraceae bacterium]|jgi:flagellar motor switch protein FliN/FliY
MEDVWKLEEIETSDREKGNLSINFLRDVELEIEVVLGRGSCTIRELISLERDDVVPLDRSTGEPVDIHLNGRLFAKGEVVVIDDKFSVRILEIVDPKEL